MIEEFVGGKGPRGIFVFGILLLFIFACFLSLVINNCTFCNLIKFSVTALGIRFHVPILRFDERTLFILAIGLFVHVREEFFYKINKMKLEYKLKFSLNLLNSSGPLVKHSCITSFSYAMAFKNTSGVFAAMSRYIHTNFFWPRRVTLP